MPKPLAIPPRSTWSPGPLRQAVRSPISNSSHRDRRRSRVRSSGAGRLPRRAPSRQARIRGVTGDVEGAPCGFMEASGRLEHLEGLLRQGHRPARDRPVEPGEFGIGQVGAHQALHVAKPLLRLTQGTAPLGHPGGRHHRRETAGGAHHPDGVAREGHVPGGGAAAGPPEAVGGAESQEKHRRCAQVSLSRHGDSIAGGPAPFRSRPPGPGEGVLEVGGRPALPFGTGPNVGHQSKESIMGTGWSGRRCRHLSLGLLCAGLLGPRGNFRRLRRGKREEARLCPESWRSPSARRPTASRPAFSP